MAEDRLDRKRPADVRAGQARPLQPRAGRRASSALEGLRHRLRAMRLRDQAPSFAALLLAGAVGYGLAWLIHVRPGVAGAGRPSRVPPLTDARRRALEAWEHMQDGADTTIAGYPAELAGADHRHSEGPGW